MGVFLKSQKLVSLMTSLTDDPKDDRLMDTDKFREGVTASRPFLSTYGLELWRRYSPKSILDMETVLSLVVTK